NHLDIRSCEALEEALKEFPGTIIAVSHDRYFLDRLIDRLLVMRPSGCVVYEGNYSYYLEQIEQESLRGKPGASPGRKKSKQKAKQAKRSKTASSPFDRLSVEELEEIVMKRETELAELHERFGEPAVYLDPDLLIELREQAEQVERDLAAADAAWQQRVDSQ
ncbi:MAG: ABC-F family ATP-binding cassette domain-containing protein, partial [Planctomycetes bacterium]|nr:ABC-F family ATP-binding cassette domain-containing protein [Planctomycetota bacterium]